MYSPGNSNNNTNAGADSGENSNTTTTTNNIVGYRPPLDKYERFEAWLRENGAVFDMVRLCVCVCVCVCVFTINRVFLFHLRRA